MTSHPSQRWLTVTEAVAALPRVTEVVERARRAVADIRARAGAVREAAGGNGHAGPATEAEVFDRAIADLAADGIVLRDPDQGLIDFPARSASGRPYWLCWVVGEESVAFWHWPEDGFAGRTPVIQLPD